MTYDELSDLTDTSNLKAAISPAPTWCPSSVTEDFNIDRQLWGIVYKGKQDDAIRDEVNLAPVIVIK